MERFKRLILCAAASLLCFSMLCGCISGPFATSGAEGIWYEQAEGGSTITVKGSEMTYKSDIYEDTVRFSRLNTDDGFELVPEEDWIYIDIFYNAVGDELTARTYPHTDGDGGYNLVVFARNEYVAPPPPVYGERIDNSDPDAPKGFSDYTVKNLTLTVTEPWRDNGDMAQELPDQGEYSYELTAGDDGTGSISSDFCRTVDVSEAQMAELSSLLSSGRLPELNGLDVITEEMPEETQAYELNIEFASGETYHSRANGSDITEIWDTDGRELHKFLFGIFEDAGYYPWSGEFHSTQPMKRIGPADGTECSYSVTVDLETIEKDNTSYDYELTAEYPVFKVEGNASDGLKAALGEITEHYKALCMEDIDYEYPIMESVSESTWKNEDHLYAYSFYATTHEEADDTKYCFWISEGHVNCFGLGKHGYGDYSYLRFCLDAETGELLSLSDFFTDDAILRERITALLEEHNTSDDASAYLHSEEYQKKLLKGLTEPESGGGIGFEAENDGISILVNESFDDVLFYPYNLKLYYEDVQDILNDKYAEVRGR